MFKLKLLFFPNVPTESCPLFLMFSERSLTPSALLPLEHLLILLQ